MSQQWEDAHSDWSRGLVRLWPRHGTLLSACRGFRTSGAAVTFVLGKFQDVWKVPRHVGLPLYQPSPSDGSETAHAPVCAHPSHRLHVR